MSTPFPPPPLASPPPPAGGPIEVRVAPASRGAEWWGDGLKMFTSQFGTWLGIVIVYGIISAMLEKVPYIGETAHWLLTPVFVGGIMVGCAALDRHEPLRFSHLFDGFKGQYFIPLLTVGVINLGLVLVAVFIGLALLVGGVGISGAISFTKFSGDPWQMVQGMGLVSLLIAVVALTLATVIIMANWFAPALIVLQDLRPVAAMTTSFRASMRNWVPFLVYGAIGACIMIAAFALFAVLVGMVGFGALMAAFQGGGGNWGSLLFAAAIFAIVYVVLLIIISPVVFGSVFSSYRDTLAP